MWKYILIVIFFLLAIREINLMNESLYIAPDSHQVVTEDKTLLSTVKHVIHKNVVKLENAIISKPKKEPQDNRTTEHPAPKKQETPLQPAPKMISTEEVNRSTPKIPLPAKAKEHPLPDLSTIESQTPKPVPQHTTKKTSLPTPEPQHAKPKPAVPLHAAAPHPLPAKPKIDPYKSAEERVKAILEEMKRHGEY